MKLCPKSILKRKVKKTLSFNHRTYYFQSCSLPHILQRALTYDLGFSNMLMLTQILLSTRMWKGKMALLLPLAISLLSHIPHVWFHFPRTRDAKYYLKNNERQSKGCRRNLWERMCFPCKFQHPPHQETERVFLVCPVEGQPFPHTWSQKDVLIGHFLDGSWKFTQQSVLPVTFLRQEKNNEGTPPWMEKPKSKRSNTAQGKSFLSTG